MAIWIFTILLGWLIWTNGKLFFLKKELRRLIRQMKVISDNSQYGSRLSLEFRERILIDFIDELNQVVDRYEQQRARMNQTEQSLNESVASTAHDLRTPLTAIKGYIQLIQTTQDESQKAEYLEMAERSLNRLVSLTDHFYEGSKSELLSPNLSKVNLNDFLEELFISYYPNFEASEIMITFPKDNKQVEVLMDIEKFTRVIENLIQNILRYGKRSAQIVILRDKKEITLIISNEVKRPENVQIDRVFHRFYTEDVARTSSRSIGVGLYSVKKIVENMGWGITAEYSKNIFSIQITLSPKLK